MHKIVQFDSRYYDVWPALLFIQLHCCMYYYNVRIYFLPQRRLDFDEFQLQPPFWGDCKHDQFYVSGDQPLPTLCGNNTGSHSKTILLVIAKYINGTKNYDKMLHERG